MFWTIQSYHMRCDQNRNKKNKQINLSNHYLKSALPFAQFLSKKQYDQFIINRRNHTFQHNLLFHTNKSKKRNPKNSNERVTQNTYLLIKKQYPTEISHRHTDFERSQKQKALTINFSYLTESTNHQIQRINTLQNQNCSTIPKMTHRVFTQRKLKKIIDQKSKIKENIFKQIQSDNSKVDHSFFKNINKILYIEEAESKNRPKLRSLQSFIRQRKEKTKANCISKQTKMMRI